MRTISTHHSGSTRLGYPARCDYCGVRWPRRELKLDGGGRLACPDDRGADATSLDKDNASKAKRFRGLTTSATAGGAWEQDAPVPAATPDAILDELFSWHRADDAVVTGSNVTSWPDRSGNNADLIEVSGTGPLLSESGGQTSILFDGDTGCLLGQDKLSIAAGSYVSVWLVLEPLSAQPVAFGTAMALIELTGTLVTGESVTVYVAPTTGTAKHTVVTTCLIDSAATTANALCAFAGHPGPGVTLLELHMTAGKPEHLSNARPGRRVFANGGQINTAAANALVRNNVGGPRFPVETIVFGSYLNLWEGGGGGTRWTASRVTYRPEAQGGCRLQLADSWGLGADHVLRKLPKTCRDR